jgi:hypothetical protein
MLYYAGSNPVFWSLSVGGGFLLLLIVACFTVFGPIPTVIFLVTVLIACFIGARLYMRPVPEGTVDIVYTFGKYTRTLYPGLNFLLPWEWVDSHLQTREKQWVCPEQTVQISRDDEVHLKAVISYQLMPEDAYLAVTRVDNWEEGLHTLFVTCLQQASNDLKPEDFIAWQGSRKGASLRLNEHEDEDSTRWARISNLLFQRMRDRVATWGVLINWVHIRDITLTPTSRSSLTYDTDPMANPRASSERAVPTPNVPPQAPQSSRKNSADSPVRQQAPAPAAPVTLKAGAATPSPAAPPSPPVAKSPKEEALITAYRQIQSEKIKSPTTIREIASRFLAIANDPEASKNVSFDAARAAQALYARADFFEKQASINEVYEDDNTPTQVDWPYQRSEEDNYTAGG